MFDLNSTRLDRAAGKIRVALSRFEVLAVFPLLVVGAFWLGREEAIFASSILLPALLAALPLDFAAPLAFFPADESTAGTSSPTRRSTTASTMP